MRDTMQSTSSGKGNAPLADARTRPAKSQREPEPASLSQLLRQAGNKRAGPKDHRSRMSALADRIWESALGGSLPAARFIYEYCAGKPRQIGLDESG